MKCAEHPQVETSLACSKCGKPICPRCLVQTPVGARCRECARLHRLPTYQVSLQHYLKGAGASAVAGAVSGFLWWLIAGIMPFFFLNLLLGAGAGYVTGEAVSLATNRKRGPALAVIASLGVVASYLVSIWLPGLFFFRLFNIFGLLAVAIGIFVSVNRLR
ncbi:MAG: hypothetical protein HYX91_00860 [Chloroflexi bacterium]|nr:hypothetical protein [Chloroflexota bacterium]